MGFQFLEEGSEKDTSASSCRPSTLMTGTWYLPYKSKFSFCAVLQRVVEDFTQTPCVYLNSHILNNRKTNYTTI